MINATSAQSIAQTNRFLLKVHLTMLDSDNCTWVAKLSAKTTRTRIEKCDVAVRGGHLRHNSSVESWSQILQTCLWQCRARLKITRPPTRGGATEPRPELRNVGRFFARLGYLSGEHLLDFMRKRERAYHDCWVNPTSCNVWKHGSRLASNQPVSLIVIDKDETTFRAYCFDI